MANLATVGLSPRTRGGRTDSELWTSWFPDISHLWLNKSINVTNGVSRRRWMPWQSVAARVLDGSIGTTGSGVVRT